MTATEQDFAAPGRYRDAFASAEFRVLFGTFVGSMLGRVMTGLALTVLVYRQTGSPLLSGLTFALEFLPYLFGGTLASGLVDRVPPRRLMAGCDLISAVGVAVMAIPCVPLPVLLALLFGVGLVMPMSAGTRSGLLPEIMAPGAVVPARSLFRLVSQGGQVAGYAMGGVLLAVTTPRQLVLAGAALLLACAVALRTGLASRPPRTGHTLSVAADSLRGLADLMRRPPIRRLMLMTWLVPMLSVVPESLAAPAVVHLGEPSSAAGWWLAAGAGGSIAGEIIGVWVIPNRHRTRLVRPLAAVLFLPTLLFVTAPPFPLALALLAMSGVFSTYALGLDQLLLEVTPAALLTRAFTVNSTGLMTLQGLGFALGGALGELMPPHLAIALSAAAGLTVVAALRSPRSFTTPTPAGTPT
jgi:MFS family permease